MQKKYTFFSSAHETFSRIDYILGHKSNLSKCTKVEIISSIFFDHNAMRQDTNYKKKTVRNTNTWRLKTTFLNNQRVMKEIKTMPRYKWQWKHDNSKPMGCSKSSPKREFIEIQSYLKKQEKIQIENLAWHRKQLEKEGKNPKTKEGKKS